MKNKRPSTPGPVKVRRRRCTRLLLGCGAFLLASCGLALAEASHAGWPQIGYHRGHPGNESGTLRGLTTVHNELLGADGNDTIYGGPKGDVIWGDKNPSGQPSTQHDNLHGGAGNDWIYSSHGYNHIWTGGGEDHVALVYGSGIVDCNGRGVKKLVMRYLPQNRHWQLVGCNHKVIEPYKA